MQRNWELVRKILLKLEEQPASEGYLDPEQIAGFDTETVCYHMRLLDDAGLIKAKVWSFLEGSSACAAISLTWDGHEFLDKIRKDTMWNKVKSKAKEKGVDLSIDVIKLAAKAVLGEVFGSDA